MPSCNTYHLTWVSLTLGVGYLFTAAPAKRSRCSLPWTRGISSRRCFIRQFQGCGQGNFKLVGLPPLPLAAGKLGAFVAPLEEDLQAERMSPLRHPSLSLSPLTNAHLEPLASCHSPAANPHRPPSCGIPTSKAPTFSSTPPLPLHLERPLQCGNVPTAQTDRSSLQSGAEAGSGPGQ